MSFKKQSCTGIKSDLVSCEPQVQSPGTTTLKFNYVENGSVYHFEIWRFDRTLVDAFFVFFNILSWNAPFVRKSRKLKAKNISCYHVSKIAFSRVTRTKQDPICVTSGPPTSWMHKLHIVSVDFRSAVTSHPNILFRCF